MKHDLSFKTGVHSLCILTVNKKIAELEKQISDLTDNLKGETKSSAGDKYETSVAMTHLEQEKLSGQLYHWKNILKDLESPQQKPFFVCSHGIFYLAGAIGKIEHEGSEVMVISRLSPLGTVLLTLKPKDKKTVNGTEYQLLEVV